MHRYSCALLALTTCLRNGQEIVASGANLKMLNFATFGIPLALKITLSDFRDWFLNTWYMFGDNCWQCEKADDEAVLWCNSFPWFWGRGLNGAQWRPGMSRPFKNFSTSAGGYASKNASRLQMVHWRVCFRVPRCSLWVWPPHGEGVEEQRKTNKPKKVQLGSRRVERGLLCTGAAALERIVVWPHIVSILNAIFAL